MRFSGKLDPEKGERIIRMLDKDYAGLRTDARHAQW
jgi:hypothetical protein